MSVSFESLWLAAPLILLVVAVLCVGSFIAVVVTRLPEGRSLLWGRSRCDHCGGALGMGDLIPVLSWLLLRGRCRQCRSPISPLYTVTEVMAVVVALWTYTVCQGWAAAAGIMLGWQLLALALIDWRTMLLPRVLTAGLIVSGLVVSAVATGWLPVDQMVGAAVGYLAFQGVALCYRHLRRREGLGQGDAKLLAGLGAWVGWQGVPTVVSYAAISALLYLVVRRLGNERVSADTALPFGPFIAFGGWLVWLYGPIIVQASSK